jgi:hypothetical protein
MQTALSGYLFMVAAFAAAVTLALAVFREGR